MRLREELRRLASGQGAASRRAAQGPKLRVAERTGGRIEFRRFLLGGLLAGFVVCVSAGGLWLHMRGRGRSKGEVLQHVRTAVANARVADSPGRETEALAQWTIARRVILLHQESAQEFKTELELAEQRIRQLQDLLQQRQGRAPAHAAFLSEARSALDDGRLAEARQKLEQLTVELKAGGIPEAERAKLEEAVKQVLADPRLASAAAASAGESGKPAAKTAGGPAASESAAQAPSRRAPGAQGTAARDPLQQRTDAVRQGSIRAEPMVLIDAPEGLQRWRAEPWANPVSVKLEADAGGAQFVALQQMEGDKGKWVVSIDQPLDVSRYDAITLEVKTEEPVTVSIAVWTEPGALIFESPAQTVPKGGPGIVWFTLKGKRFKSQTTDWQFGTEIQNPANATRLSLFMYSRANGLIRFRKLSLRRAATRPSA